MRTRIFKLGTSLLCAMALAAQVASDAFLERLPDAHQQNAETSSPTDASGQATDTISVAAANVAPPKSENTSLATSSHAATTVHEMRPSNIGRRELRSVFDGALGGTVFENPSQLVQLVDHEEVQVEVEEPFPPMTLPDPHDNPAFVAPTPGSPPLPQDLPAPPLPLQKVDTYAVEEGTIGTLPQADADTSAGVNPLELPSPEATEELVDSDDPFPALTLPPPDDAEPTKDDPFRFKPRNPLAPSPRFDTKETSPTQRSPLPEPVATPLPRKDQSMLEALDIPESSTPATVPLIDTPPVDFGSFDRDESQILQLQAARNAFRLGEGDTAIQRFTDYLRSYPDDAEIRFEFAGVLSAHNRAGIGAKQIEHLLAQFPDNVAVLRRYANMQMQLQQFAKAEPILDRLLRYREHRIDAAVDLARVYANTGRRQAAVQIYEEILRAVAAKEPGRQLQFAKLLLDIRRPTEALELLWELHGREPLDMEILRLTILASARTGNRANTFAYIERLQSIEPENIGARYAFARQLFQDGLYRESLLIDQQILDFEPGNEDSRIRSAMAYLRLYEPLQAQAMLAGVTRETQKPEYLRTMAAYHSLVGEHADAIAICRRVLSEHPEDLATRLVLGDVYLRATQLQRSIDTFSQVANVAREAGVENGQQLFIDATLSHARALAEAKRFGDAYALLESTDWPTVATDAVLDTYLAVQSQARHYRGGIQSARMGLADALGYPRREIRLRSWLGLLLARNGEYASALQELSVAEQMADEILPEAVYGKYQAYRMLGDTESANRLRAKHLGPFAGDSYLRVRLASLATEDCDCCLAREVLQPLDGMCDANPLIANRLGEACLMCASCETTPDCAGYFQRALTTSPANIQAILGIARTLSRVKNYEAAYCYYQKAERYMADDLDLKREIARLVREWQGPEPSQVAYDRAMQLTTTEHLVEEAKRSPDLLPELEREYASRADFGAIVATEMTGKQLSGWMPLSAITVFEGVAQMEPHNQDAIFEIGQAYSQLNRTHCAMEQYERLLCLNPCHREAQVALDRNRREISPQLHLYTRASSQKGRQDLSTIDHFRAGHVLQFPLGDEDEYLQFGYARPTYDPPGAPQLDGHIAMGRIQWKPVWPVVLFAELDYEIYDYGFQPRFNYDIGSRFRYIENAELRVHVRQENVAQNRVAIRRDIHRWGSELGNYWLPSQRFEVDTLFRYWEYSDDNQSIEGGVHSGYQLTHGRDRLRWLTDFDWMAYRHETKFADSNVLESVNNPYFAPDLFWFLSGGLELRHYFGCDTFKAGNRRWIEGYVGGRVDSDGVAYGSVRGELLWDYHTRLTLLSYFEYLTSDTYTNGELGLKLTLRY